MLDFLSEVAMGGRKKNLPEKGVSSTVAAIGSASAQRSEQDEDIPTGPKRGNRRGRRRVGSDDASLPLPTSPSRNTRYQSKMGLKDPPQPVGNLEEIDDNLSKRVESGDLQVPQPVGNTEEIDSNLSQRVETGD